jgi:hypothetical protein
VASLSLVFDLLARDKASAEFRKVGDAADDTGKRVGMFGGAIGGAMKVAAGALAAAGIGSMFKDAITGASDLSETINKSNVIFGANAGKVRDWSKNAARSFGLSQEAALNAASGFGNMLQQLGFTGEAALEASTGTVKLAADLGSFNNLDTGDVLDRIGAAMRGEYDSLQLLIPNINAARVESEALAMTGKTVASELTAQEKAAATLAIVQKDGAAAANDFAETSDGLANKTKIAAAQFDDMKAKIGQAFLPAITGAMGFVTDTAFPALEGLGDKITGTVIPGIQGLFDLVVKGDFSGKLRQAFGVEEDNPVVGFILDAREALLGFLDGISIDWGSIFVNIKNAAISAGGDLLAGFKTGIDTGNWAPLGESIVRIAGNALSMVGSLSGKLFGAISDLIAKVDWAKLALEFGRQVPTLLLGLVTGILNFDFSSMISFIGDHLFEVLLGILTIVFLPAKIFGALTGFLAKIPLIGPMINWFLKGIRGVGGKIVGWIGDIIGAFWRGLTGGGGMIVSAVRGWFDTIRTAVFVWADDFVKWLGGLPGRFSQWIIDLAERAGALFRTMGQNLWNIVKGAFDAIGGLARSLYDVTLRPIFTLIGNVWGALGRGIGTVYHGFIRPIFDAFGRLAATLRDGFQTAVNGIASIWDGLKARLRGPVQFAVDVVWNNGLRALWNTLNNLWGGADIRPFRFARGGVMPGYTPGRDVHRFVSPTGGSLELSGGEAVMRPEFTRALGAANIDLLNQIARQEGEAGLRRVLATGLTPDVAQHFAGGGIVQLPGWLDLALRFMPGGGAIRGIVNRINGANAGGGLFGAGIIGMGRTIAGNMWEAAKRLFGSGPAPGGGGPAGGGALGGTWHSIWNVVKAAIPQARINSTYRPGDPGYHGRNKAIDFGFGSGPGGAGSAGLASINRFLHDRFGRNLAELIYDGIGDDRPDLKNGRPLTYNAGARAAHRNHVHAAVYDSGGLLPPGLTVAYNGTGKTETVLTAEQTAAQSRPIVVNIYGLDFTKTSDRRRIITEIHQGIQDLDRERR